MTETTERRADSEIPPIVLGVEDDRDTRDMHDALLSNSGFWVMQAGEAAEAFGYARDFYPDAVLTDLGLAGESNGAELIRALRADPVFALTPIIAVTGRRPRELPSLRGLAISAVLLKPVSPGALVDRVNAALRHSSGLRARRVAPGQRIPAQRSSRAAAERSARRKI